MNIGEVSVRSGLPAKTIRYYEDIGLLKPLRDTNGYRSFRTHEVYILAFLGQSIPSLTQPLLAACLATV